MKKEFLSVLSLSFLLSTSFAFGQVETDSIQEKTIEEVLINVGYGLQKKSVVTGAISQVTSKDLEKVPNGRVEQTLQGRTAGLNIASNSGSPGSAATIRVRGITTFGAANGPIWVVDGVQVDANSIGMINQADIESVEVLKDAASAAIYGTRAAAGVILVTTKKGRKGKMDVNYNGFLGFSSPERVVKLLNATEYGAILNERSVAAGGNVIFSDLASLGKGTDWQKQVFNKSAQRSNHEVSVSGGAENSTFFLSFGYQDQEGIVATQTSSYNKKTFRINSQHKLFGKINVGQNFSYGYQKQRGIGNQNTEFGGVLASALMMDPLTPVIEYDPIKAAMSPYNQDYIIRDVNGNPYGISSMVGQEIVNPLAFVQTQLGNFGWSDDFVGNVFADAEIFKGLTVRSSLGGKLSFWGNQFFSPKYYLNPSTLNQNMSSITRNNGKALDWTITNTITYARQLGDHDFSVMIGQEANELGIGFYGGVTHSNLPTNSWYQASFNFDLAAKDKIGWSSDYVAHRLNSLFARVNYNYKERYLLTGIFRRDGSSRFGPNNKYANFPSFSLGWMVSKEAFWPENNIVNNLKFRGGYGTVGNTGALANFQYLALVGGGYNYTFNDAIVVGSAPRTLDNPDLRWEETSQANIGVETTFFKNLNITVDAYQKKTSGILQQVRIPGYVGVTDAPWANIADMENKGIEAEVSYKKNFENWGYGITGVFSTLKNTVTNIGLGVEYITQDAPSFQSMGEITRTQVGQAYNSFYGFQTLGIFQNWNEVNAYTNANGGLIQPNAQPGDFRWQDSNGDGLIDDNDKVFLGSPLPKYNFGLTVNFNYKSFDLMAFAQGAAGNKIFQGLRRLDVSNANYQREVLDRWTGEGTSDDYPRLTNDDSNRNFTRMSDFYLEKGDYLRLKILQIGYTLPLNAAETIRANKIRLYVTGENLYTLTKYTGYDPEIGGTVFGIDKGYYPQARSFMFGVNVQF